MIEIKFNKKKKKKGSKTMKTIPKVPKKKIENSKKLAWFSGVCFVISLIYSMLAYTYSILFNQMCDYSILITLITTTGAVFGVTMVTYGNKSRFENVIKLQNSGLKLKYLILKDIRVLDEHRIQSELDNELSRIEADFENEKSMSNQEITYNG